MKPWKHSAWQIVTEMTISTEMSSELSTTQPQIQHNVYVDVVQLMLLLTVDVVQLMLLLTVDVVDAVDAVEEVVKAEPPMAPPQERKEVLDILTNHQWITGTC